MGDITISNLIKSSLTKFPSNDLTTIKIDIQSIFCEALGVDKTYLYLNPNKILHAQQLQNIEQKILQLSQGEPLAYILGYKYFWKQKLIVSKHTLIPRADTETLVQAILDNIKNKNAKLKILDLGTGTGAIALALADEFSNSEVVAVDFSQQALEIAKKNARENDIHNVRFLQSNWYNALDSEMFDIIVSNPPYIGYEDDIDFEVKKYEPKLALFAKDNGMADIKIIITQARKFLNKAGQIYIEHGFNQSAAVRKILKENYFSSIKNIQDLNNKDRCAVGHMCKI